MVSTRIQLIRNGEIRDAVMALSNDEVPITAANVFRQLTKLEVTARRKASGISRCLRLLAAAGALTCVRDGQFEVLDATLLITPKRVKRIYKRASKPADQPAIAPHQRATATRPMFFQSSIRQLTPAELTQGKARAARTGEYVR